MRTLPIVVTVTLAITFANACAGSRSTSVALTPPAQAPSEGTESGVGTGASSMGTLGVGTSGTSSQCAEASTPPESNVPGALAHGISAIAALDEASLGAHVDFDIEARTRRAMTLGDASAPAVNATQLVRAHSAAALARLLAAGQGCAATLVEGELRIDFPPAMDDTRPENAAEISAVHELLYAGTSLTAYCGGCARYALVVREEPSGLRVLAWQDLSGAAPGNQ